MRPVLAALALLLALPAFAADPPQEFVGMLKLEPVPDQTGYSPVRLAPAPAETEKELPAPPSEGDRLFTGSLPWSSDKEHHARVVLVEPAQGDPSLYADTDLDGKLSAAERYTFTSEGKGFPVTVLRFRWEGGPFPSYPVRVGLPSSANVKGLSTAEGQRLLMSSNAAHLEGTVEIDGRKILVRSTFFRAQGQLDPLRGEFAMDVDGDGSIDPFFGSSEVETAEGAPAVFRIGERYVSVRALDPAAGRIVLRTHPASDYKRFDLSEGAQIPDFTFEDFDGKTRRLSDFRGKHVLLDFWATWCVPCVEEFPHLKKLHETYRSRGFEILGLNRDESAEPARAMIREKQLPWVNATPESVKEVVVKRFRALEIPVIVLLDPEGRVVARGVPGLPGLREEDLVAMLEKRLPAQGR